MSVNEKMTAIADAIREKTGGTEKLTLDDMPGQIGGIKAEPIWFPYVTGCSDMFDTVTFPENTELVIEFQTITKGFNYMFRNAKNVKSIKLIVHDNTTNTCIYIFASPDIQRVDLSEFNVNVSNWTNAFYGAKALEEIIGEMGGQNFSNTFYNCTSLREVRCAEGAIITGLSFSNSSLLSDASIQSIIDGLADLTGVTAQKVSFHTAVLAKLTDEQLFQIYAKNWTM